MTAIEEDEPVDEEPAPTEGRMSLIDHLTELRTRLIRIAIAVAAGAIVAWIFYDQIFAWLIEPYCNVLPTPDEVTDDDVGLLTTESCALFVTEPLEEFSTRISVSAYTGLAFAIPIILFQVWKFVTPGLYPHERRYAIPFVGLGASLFALGAGLAYWSIPRALELLTTIGGDNLVSLFSPKPYLNFVVKMMLAFGFGFQFPLLLAFLQIIGVLENKTLRNNRRYAIVGIVILVAVITPSGDPFTLGVLTIPMYIFYEGAIAFGWLRMRRQRKRAESAT